MCVTLELNQRPIKSILLCHIYDIILYINEHVLYYIIIQLLLYYYIISYCLSAWGGFLNAEQIGRINALFLRARKYILTDNFYDFVGLLQHLDYKLFKSMQSGIHCLNWILPPKKFDNQRLRIKGHNYCLPKCLFELYK
jgi:hypothetical protein